MSLYRSRRGVQFLIARSSIISFQHLRTLAVTAFTKSIRVYSIIVTVEVSNVAKIAEPN
jgi:hypothetical protein